MKIGWRMAGSAALALAGALSLASCASAPKDVPRDLSAEELVQRAQEASDAYDYSTAVAFYQALAERFGADPGLKAAADYEIAFIAYKQGRTAEARVGLEELLSRYASPEGKTLPPRYQILAQNVLKSIAGTPGGK
jgi:outer membrane protein assembly factor BamD (BamD/ComL family)